MLHTMKYIFLSLAKMYEINNQYAQTMNGTNVIFNKLTNKASPRLNGGG